MTVSGFTFIRNGVRFDYPFLESIHSLLPLVDEFVIAVGDSDDGTRDRLSAIHSPKIRLIDTVWDPDERQGGTILAQQTNIALGQTTGDWAFYLQGDEVLHEADWDIIQSGLAQAHSDERIEGILFDYVHFYGSYDWVGNSRRWYRREVRLIRNRIGVRSWGDAQGFRREGKKLKVCHLPATIFHYGWVKPPKAQQDRLRSFHGLWHADEWVKNKVGGGSEYSYADGGRLRRFQGTHPAVMSERAARQDWKFEYDPLRTRIRPKDRLLDAVEDLTGYRVGEYRNYELL